MKKILLVSFSDVNRAPIEQRQIEFFRENYELHVAAFGNYEAPGIKFYEIIPAYKGFNFFQRAFFGLLTALSFYEIVLRHIYDYSKAKEQLEKINFDLVVVHDLYPLPLCFNLKRNAKVLFTAHEYYYDQTANYFTRKLDYYLLQKYLPKVDRMITVSGEIAKMFSEKLGKKVEVIRNAVGYKNLQPRRPGDKIRIIHHGLVDPLRQTEISIEMMDFTDERFELDLMLMSNSLFSDAYLEKLRKMCSSRKNVRIIPPIKTTELEQFCNQYDIGLFILPPANQSYYYSLGNKFFQYIQSRLMIAVSPNPEMAKLVQQYDLGVVSVDFTAKAMADLLNALTSDKLWYYKNQSDKYAKELSAENEMKKLWGIVDSIGIK